MWCKDHENCFLIKQVHSTCQKLEYNNQKEEARKNDDR